MAILTRVTMPLATLLHVLRTQAAGVGALIMASIVAFAWSNSPFNGDYQAILAWKAGPLSIQAWINDGLMTLFFLLVGLEIRREARTGGALSAWQDMAAPGSAAIGGMVVPALIFLFRNQHDPATAHGWAIPMATDIAFSLAVLRGFGKRIPATLVIFMAALAIIDDLGAIIVIAVFYTASVKAWALISAGLLWLGLYVLSRMRVQMLWPYLLGGGGLWLLMHFSGIHPTLAGVALALVIPLQDKNSPAARLQNALDAWVSLLVLPSFGLANAGLRLFGLHADMLMQPLVSGIGLGLILGKPIGVLLGLVTAQRFGICRWPAGISKAQITGTALLCGIGFTMSLFIGNLAFQSADLQRQIKLGVFAASSAAAVLGVMVLLAAHWRAVKMSAPVD